MIHLKESQHQHLPKISAQPDLFLYPLKSGATVVLTGHTKNGQRRKNGDNFQLFDDLITAPPTPPPTHSSIYIR